MTRFDPCHRSRVPRWGRLENDVPPGWGWNAFTLFVHPPDISPSERRRIWFRGASPFLGAAIGIIAFAAGATALPPWSLVFIVIAAVAAAAATGRILSRDA
jgi:hypothetical protein